MPERESHSCANYCCRFIFTLGLASLFLWLSLRVKNPVCSIENFDVFALNKTSPKFSMYKNNHTISYDLKLNNKNNKDKGIYYDTLNLTFYYKKPNVSLIALGNATFDHFYQGHEKSTHRINTLDVRGVKWEIHNVTPPVFRVELNTSVRFKIVFWKTKRHRLDLGADFEVNDQGSLVKKKKKGIKLTSDARKSKVYYFGLLHLSLLILFCFL